MSTKELLREFGNLPIIKDDAKDLYFSVADDIAKLNISDGVTIIPAITYCIPEFSCHQSPEELIIVIKVDDLNKDSVKIDYGNKELRPSSSCCITCTSKDISDKRCPTVNNSLFLRFFPECLIQSGKEMVTASETNAVICFSKHKDSQHHWEFFYYGLDADNTPYQQHLTVSALQHKLDILQRETKRIMESNEGVPDSQVQIGSIDDNHVEINFEDSELPNDTESTESNAENSFEQSWSSPTDTNECTVISSAATKSESGINEEQQNESSSISSTRGPIFRRFRSVSECSGEIHIKGILKNVRRRSHTVSESSDDYSWSSQDYNGIDSDIPEEDHSDNASQIKKSVHFNDNVYRSFFRSNSSILGQREKNRRKWKKKQELRRRRSSEGDGSSSVETDEQMGQQKIKFVILPMLDINQNHSSTTKNNIDTNNYSETLDNGVRVVLEPSAVCESENNNSKTKGGDRKRRRKKKNNSIATETGSDDKMESTSDDFDNAILVLTSSPESHLYQRHRRYFSRHRQTSI